MDNHDTLLFKGTAYYYSRFRRGYPSFFFDYLLGTFNLDRHSRVLDLGTGTGQIAIPIAKAVKEVVAIDPDVEMLEEGKKAAGEKKINNITWIKATAENLPEKIGSFDLTTMGSSFHWMEQDKVLRSIYSITNINGGIAIVSNTTSIYRNVNNEEWKNVVRRVIEKYLGERRRAGNSYYKKPAGRFEDIIKRSEFSNLQIYDQEYTQEWTIDQILGYLSSTSFASRRLFGDRIESFEEDLRAELLKLNRSGVFTEKTKLEALIAWKTQ